MGYFKGSRRRVKKSSHSVSRDNSKTESTDLQAVHSPENRQIQRKRSPAADNTEKEQTQKSKRSKLQSSSSKSLITSTGRGQTSKKKATKTTNDNDNPVSLVNTGHKRNKKTELLSSSESDGNLHLTDESQDSLTLPDSDELCEQSDRKFLRQQIKILKTPFHLENDCPALSRVKANDSKHIPLQVVQNTLRKVNHKTEDELLRSLNRLAQRKLLDSLRASRPESTTDAASHEQLKRQKEVQTRVANLEEAHHEIRQEHAQYKCIGVLVSQLEAISEEFNNKQLIDEIQKTNEFVVSSSSMTTRKDKDLNSHTGARAGVEASNYIPSTHEQLVQTLFKD
ncbi:hypothetical protein ACROYT_G043316 [Oculina patagonica]